MPRFTVPDMSCGHCTAAIEKAIKEVDTGSSVDCNLDDRTVAITSALPQEDLQAAMEAAGYPSQPA
ncbi:heavy-metal-associated domain-containing protein [Tropicimonas marinistellae]|uniref:heavy-metal-associated domain-containing protein n=1 Tax=Tropicimonas marinistellae TaxID=1739787 RepID=UPI00082D9984|nr:heavy-metal-associated domain-containing protein [Tropicimonas marinistellae]